MEISELIHHLNNTLLVILTVSGPILGVAAGVGLLVGLLQAVTQVQDQSLPQTMKLVAILVTIVLLGSVLSTAVVRETRNIFDEFPAIAHSDQGA